MAEEPASGHDTIGDLRERVSRLEARLARLEQGTPLPDLPAAPVIARVDRLTLDTDLTVASVFTRVAMLSFVLMGALILRELTQQHVLNAGFGTVLGFAYAAHLIVLGLLPGRPGRFARATSLFQCCGVMLAFGIALESTLRAHTLARPTALVAIGGFALLALGVATVCRKATLAATALVGGVLALVGLGLDADGLALQWSLLVLLAALAAGLSWRRTWGFLRPVLFPLLMTLMAVGFPLADKAALDRGPLYACAAAFWLVLALQHGLAFQRLGGAAVWLPLSTLWLGVLVGLAAWPFFAVSAAALSALAFLGTLLATRACPAAAAGVTGLAATATIAGLVGWPLLDASGVLCALAGLALWTVAPGGPSRPAWAAGSAVVLLSAAAVRGVVHLVHTGMEPLPMLAGALLAALLLVHYLRTDRPLPGSPSGTAQHVAPVILAAGLLVLFAILRALASGFLSAAPASFQLAQTGILTGAAVVLTFCGKASQRRAVLYGGLACMLISLVKVGVIDLSRLSGIRLLMSIVLLGLSSVGVSVILRHRA